MVDACYPNVLVVEDDLDHAKLIVDTLQRANLTVELVSNIQEAIVRAGRHDRRIDAALIEHRLPDGDSLELVKLLRAREPTCSATVVATLPDQGLARQYREQGAFRFITKPLSSMQVLTLVHATILDSQRWRQAGDSDLTESEVPPPVIVDFDPAADRLRYIANLSPTEREVAYWVLQGKRDSEIASLLGRAERTAKRHVGQVLSKAGVKNRASLWSVLHQDSEERVRYSSRRAPRPPLPPQPPHASSPSAPSSIPAASPSPPLGAPINGAVHPAPGPR